MGIYVLQEISEFEKDFFWKDTYPKLLQLFDGIPFDLDHQDLLINRSVMEYEAKLALKIEHDKERVFWTYHKFGQSEENINIDTTTDLLESHDTKRLHFDNFITYMQKTIPSNRRQVYDKCSYASYKNKDDQWKKQWDKWREDIRQLLTSSLHDIIILRTLWNMDGCGLGNIQSS